MIRANEYVCYTCNYTIEQDKYEETLTLNIKYNCPHCKHNGETQIPFKRKKIQRLDEESQKKVVIEAFRFYCEKCNKPLDITKKMK